VDTFGLSNLWILDTQPLDSTYHITSVCTTFLQVVLVDLEVLAEISSSRVAHKFPLSRKVDETLRVSADVQQRLSNSTQGRLNSYFTHSMISLLKLFSTDRQLLDDRGSVIIRFVVVMVVVVVALVVVVTVIVVVVKLVIVMQLVSPFVIFAVFDVLVLKCCR